MENKIKQLLEEAELEINNELDKIDNQEQPDQEVVMYWATRIQALKEVLEIIESSKQTQEEFNEERIQMIENFIMWYSSDEKERRRMIDAAENYIKEDHEEVS